MNQNDVLIVIYLFKWMSWGKKRWDSKINLTLINLHGYTHKIICLISNFLFIFLITINISNPNYAKTRIVID